MIDLTDSGAILHRFALTGQVVPLSALQKATGAQKRPASRPMGGWLMTYGKIGPDGGIVPTVDRDGQTVEAAKQLGDIDWSTYLKGGLWNDTHDESTIVGMPSTLEFHDGTTALSKSHGKVGFWTTGALFDRADPSSWAALGRTPSPRELARADHFWSMAHLLKGTPRPLGFSAHGSMALSPCRKRIIYAKVDHAAVCELPVNPDATAEVMELARHESILEHLRKGMVGASPCTRCKCPPGSCEGLLRKGDSGMTTGAIAPLTPQDLDGAVTDPTPPTSTEEKIARLVAQVAMSYRVSDADARRWVASFLHDRLDQEHPDG